MMAKPGPYEQRAWTERLAQRLNVPLNRARELMAMAEADLADAGSTECDFEDIYQLAADRGV
jgi:hypothetical protein